MLGVVPDVSIENMKAGYAKKLLGVGGGGKTSGAPSLSCVFEVPKAGGV